MNADELTRWFTERRADLHDIARRIVDSAAEAEDIVQDAWLKMPALPSEAPPFAWFATVVRNLAIDRIRHRRIVRLVADARSPGTDVDAADVEDRAAAREEAAAVLRAMIAILSPLEVAAVILREVFDADHASIAASAGKSVGATRVLVHRALRRLRRDRHRHRDAQPDPDDRLLFAVCRHALEQCDVRLLHAVLADERSSIVSQLRRPAGVPAVGVGVIVGGRPAPGLRQAAASPCAPPVGAIRDACEADA